MKALENLPNYDIFSKASDLDSLKQADVDENNITNINSRYYPAGEFKKMNNENSFNIFHTNVNGLEHKFNLLHHFVNSSELDIDLISRSETSQKEERNSDINIAMDGYRLPFSTGSKTSRGGDIIYVKNGLSVFESDDLNMLI